MMCILHFISSIDRSSGGVGAYIQLLLNLSEEELETMGRNGRRLVEAQYSSRKVAEEMVRMYEGLTPGPSPKERGEPCGGVLNKHWHTDDTDGTDDHRF